MRDETVWFGEVRSALAGEADAAGWARLCALLAAPEAEVRAEQWLPYVTAELARRWPDAARVAPRAWAERAAAGEPPAAWPLVRECALDGLIGGDEALEQLLTRGVFDGLRALDLSRCALSWRGVSALIQRARTQLTSLKLNEDPLGASLQERVSALREHGWQSAMMREDLEVLGAAAWARLETLEMRGCGLTLGGFEYLFCRAQLTNLSIFVGDENPQIGLGEPHWSLMVVGSWSGLRELSLVGCGDVHLIVEMFDQDNMWLGLERLDMSGCQLDERVMRMLMRGVERLKVLRLCDAGLDAAGARQLAQVKWSQGLEVLALDGNDLGEEGYAALAQSPYMSEALRRQFL